MIKDVALRGVQVAPRCLVTDGALTIAWPIWDGPASLAAIQALLGHPSLVSAEGDGMRHLGVIERRC